MNNTIITIFDLVKAVFHRDTFQIVEGIDWDAVFLDMNNQKIITMVGDLCDSFPIDEIAKSKWKKYLITSRIKYEKILKEQERIFEMLDGIPTVVLKGTAVAIYYPQPYFRTMGDIDILVDRGYYDKAQNILSESYEHKVNDGITHTDFENGNVKIELHKGMASHYVGTKQEYFDEILFKAMDKLEKQRIGDCEFWIFPKTENGLILIRHMHQHMLEGVGLRHVVDWMAYMEDKESVDWILFKQVAQEVGMYKFLRVMTRMCEIYLDTTVDSTVRELLDLDNVDENLCERLMEYVVSRGNFGSATDTYASKFAMKDVHGNVLKRLQLGGICRWKAAQKYKVLRPFAWIYQVVRISKEMLRHDGVLKALKRDLEEAEKLKTLMKDLELECNSAWAK